MLRQYHSSFNNIRSNQILSLAPHSASVLLLFLIQAYRFALLFSVLLCPRIIPPVPAMPFLPLFFGTYTQKKRDHCRLSLQRSPAYACLFPGGSAI